MDLSALWLKYMKLRKEFVTSSKDLSLPYDPVQNIKVSIGKSSLPETEKTMNFRTSLICCLDIKVAI